jgi:hypothetical protein
MSSGPVFGYFSNLHLSQIVDSCLVAYIYHTNRATWQKDDCISYFSNHLFVSITLPFCFFSNRFKSRISGTLWIPSFNGVSGGVGEIRSCPVPIEELRPS